MIKEYRKMTESQQVIQTMKEVSRELLTSYYSKYYYYPLDPAKKDIQYLYNILRIKNLLEKEDKSFLEVLFKQRWKWERDNLLSD